MRRLPRRRLAALALALALSADTGTPVGPKEGTTMASTTRRVAVSSLFVDPQSAAARWVAAHPDDPRSAVLAARVAGRPQARWLTDPDPGRTAAQVTAYVTAAADAGAVPVVVAYVLPGRDCGGASAGGVDGWPAYSRWVAAVGDALGPGRSVVVLEPDSLALQTCLTPAAAEQREEAIAAAVADLTRRAPAAQVFLDGGHSAWVPVDVQARRLRAAGVDQAAGFATNVSNYRTTVSELAYGRRLRAALGGVGRQVVDTGRNGAGPLGAQWCDPAGRALGTAPALFDDSDPVAGFLWVKPPGEADGCAGPAGVFLPDVAMGLATSGPST